MPYPRGAGRQGIIGIDSLPAIGHWGEKKRAPLRGAR